MDNGMLPVKDPQELSDTQSRIFRQMMLSRTKHQPARPDGLVYSLSAEANRAVARGPIVLSPEDKSDLDEIAEYAALLRVEEEARNEVYSDDRKIKVIVNITEDFIKARRTHAKLLVEEAGDIFLLNKDNGNVTNKQLPLVVSTKLVQFNELAFQEKNLLQKCIGAVCKSILEQRKEGSKTRLLYEECVLISAMGQCANHLHELLVKVTDHVNAILRDPHKWYRELDAAPAPAPKVEPPTGVLSVLAVDETTPEHIKEAVKKADIDERASLQFQRELFTRMVNKRRKQLHDANLPLVPPVHAIRKPANIARQKAFETIEMPSLQKLLAVNGPRIAQLYGPMLAAIIDTPAPVSAVQHED